MVFLQSVTQEYSEKSFPSSPNRSRTYDLPVASPGAIPLSYRRPVEARPLYSVHVTNILRTAKDWNIDEWNMGNGSIF